MKLNNKGFTLIEILAVVIILSIIIAIMVPSVNYLIDKNKEDNYKQLEKSIINGTKVYLSDNRYNITLNYDSGLCEDEEAEESIASISENDLIDSKILISTLVDNKTLTTNSNGNILNPKNNEEILDLDNSYVLVKYQCSNKDYTYTLEENSLVWLKEILYKKNT